jgi:hypothetical protein
MSIEEWCIDRGWICHLSAKWRGDRYDMLRRLIRISIATDDKLKSSRLVQSNHNSEGHMKYFNHYFRQTVRIVKEALTVRIDSLKIAEEMNDISIKSKRTP